jgi:hypothetical protein
MGAGMLSQLNAAIGSAMSRADLDHIAQTIWRALAAGALAEGDAEVLAAKVASRQRTCHQPRQSPGRYGNMPKRQRSPDRQRSLERRRRLAASGGLPPTLACRFTVGQLAVLRVVADEVRTGGVCGLCLAAIAARAGVCRTTARDAVREAARLGLLICNERRRRGQKSLTNLLRIVSNEWLTWIRIGGKKTKPTDNMLKQDEKPAIAGQPQRGNRGERAVRPNNQSIDPGYLQAASGRIWSLRRPS